MFTTRPELRGHEGMVASTHWLASGAGMAALERGGNAFDAAAVAGFVLQVVEPHTNGPGGEAPIVAYDGGHDRVFVVSGQGTAPAAATIDRYTSMGLSFVPGSGLLAATVPGAFDAWFSLLAEHGTFRVRDVLEPAVGYAEKGFPMLGAIAGAVAVVADFFTEHWPTSAEIYLGGGVPQDGSLFRNPALAATYRKIIDEAESASSDRDEQIQAARDAIYRGFVAEAIDRFVSTTEVMDSSGDRHAGLLTADDMADYRSGFEAPVQHDFGSYTVCKTGPWGQGPVFLQQLALLSGFDLAAMGNDSPEYVHTVIECAKLAFADREAWYGDPDFVDVPLDGLLSAEYNAQRRMLVGDDASHDLRPGTVDGRAPVLPELPDLDAPSEAYGSGIGEPTIATSQVLRGPNDGDTCHIDVVDRHGNMVSATPSGGWLQSSPVIPGLGFPLGTRAQMFWLDDRVPNRLEPGKRPRTTLTPSFALRDGKPYLAFGTPGGDQQDQWALTFFLNHAVFGMTLQEAIDAPAFHTAEFMSSFFPRVPIDRNVAIESRFADRVFDELRRRGHNIAVDGAWTLGRVSAAGRDPDTGFLKAAANARGMQGYAVGR